MKTFSTIKTTLAVIAFIGSSQVSSVELDNADWYLNIDVDAIKTTPLSELLLNAQEEEVPEFFNKIFGESLIEQVSQITLYGKNKGYNDASLLVKGSFSESAKREFFSHPNINLESSTFEIEGVEIHQWLLNNDTHIVGYEDEHIVDVDKEIELLLAEVQPDLIMISQDVNDIRNWINSKSVFEDVQRNGVFSVTVNLDNALTSASMKVDQKASAFHSDLMKKISQISFSATESEDIFYLEAALNANDEQTAIQIEQILNGLLALNALSGTNNNNPLKLEVLTNLKLSKDGSNILVNTYVPYELLELIKKELQL